MRRILFLIPILFAYAIILGHNLVPHTHHNHTTEQAHHDHDKASDHHHHDHENHEQEEEGTLPDLFAHFVHSPYTVNVEHTLVLANEVKELKQVEFDAVLVSTPISIEFLLNERELPPDVRQSFSSKFAARHSSLRAPPIC